MLLQVDSAPCELRSQASCLGGPESPFPLASYSRLHFTF